MTDYYSNKLKIITESLVNLDHVKDDILFPSDIPQILDQLTKKLKSFWPTIITKHGYKISILIFSIISLIITLFSIFYIWVN